MLVGLSSFGGSIIDFYWWKCRETIHPAKVLWVFHAEQTVQCGTHYREAIWHVHMFFCYVVKKLASTLPVKTGQTVIWVNKCLSWPLHETGRTGTIPYWGQIRISSQKTCLRISDSEGTDIFRFFWKPLLLPETMGRWNFVGFHDGLVVSSSFWLFFSPLEPLLGKKRN